MVTSVREFPRSRRVEVVVIPLSGSVHTSRSGSVISTKTARVGYRLPSASLTMTVSKTPPERASTLMLSRGVLTPAGPQKWVRCSGSIMQRKTSSLGGWKPPPLGEVQLGEPLPLGEVLPGEPLLGAKVLRGEPFLPGQVLPGFRAGE